jgi:hypothetical protein
MYIIKLYYEIYHLNCLLVERLSVQIVHIGYNFLKAKIWSYSYKLYVEVVHISSTCYLSCAKKIILRNYTSKSCV